MEIPLPRIYLLPWQVKTFCFDFQDEGVMQGDTPAVLSAPAVTHLTAQSGVDEPEIGTPAVNAADFHNAKGEAPKKVPAGKGVVVRLGTPPPGATPGEYPIRCTVLADGAEALERAAIVVVGEMPAN